MRFIGRYLPIPYAAVAVVIGLVGIVNSTFVAGPHAAFLNGSHLLAMAYLYMGLGIGGLYFVVTVIQIAIIGLIEETEAEGYDEEKKRIGTMLLAWFVLALPPVAVFAVNARYEAHHYNGSGFWSEGSIVYVLAAVFIVASVAIWGLARERSWI